MAHLIVQTAFVGDLFLTIPLIEKLKQLEPEEDIYLVCRKGLGGFYSTLKIVDQVFEVEKGQSRSYKDLLKELKGYRFKTIFCPHQSLRSALFVKDLQADLKVSYKSWWNIFFFDKRVRRDMKLPEPLRLLSLVAAYDSNFAEQFSEVYSDPRVFNSLELETISSWDFESLPQWSELSIRSHLKNLEAVDDKLEALSPFVALAPGSVWATKRWTEEGFVELAHKIVEGGRRVVLIGAPDEVELCAKIESQVSKCINLAGKTNLIQLAHLLQFADCAIGNDSASMHIAAGVGVPVVSIFGPTTLKLGYRPWSLNSVVVQENLNCRPCGLHGAKSCPIGTHDCMKKIKAEQVYSAFETLIQKQK